MIIFSVKDYRLLYSDYRYSLYFCDSEYEAKMKEMSEEEYDNLDEEERKRIDSIRLDKRYVINFIT